jgi:hypothetical protein
MRTLLFCAQDNIFVRGIRSMKHAMFSETEEGETLALIKKLDPTWDLHKMLMSARRSSLPSIPQKTKDARGSGSTRAASIVVRGRVLTQAVVRLWCSARGRGSSEMGRVVPSWRRGRGGVHREVVH